MSNVRIELREGDKIMAREESWFDTGTFVDLVSDYGYYGLYEGQRHGKLDQETCSHDEFLVVRQSNGKSVIL